MKTVETCMALDFYGRLLTDKMRETLEMYYFDDLSLAEIAETENISRQGVHDTVKRAERQLAEYEQKLGLISRFLEEKKEIESAIKRIDSGDAAGAKLMLAGLIEDL